MIATLELTPLTKLTKDLKSASKLLSKDSKENTMTEERAPYRTGEAPTSAPEIRFTLTVYEYHELLRELEFAMGFINRDAEKPKALYEKLATQAAGHPVEVRLQRPPALESPQEIEQGRKGKRWWQI